MNEVHKTLFRHFLTSLATLGGFLYQHGAIDAASVDIANKAGEQLIDPLAILMGLMAAAAMRLAIFLIGKIFPGMGKSKGASMVPLWVCGMTAGLMGLSLPSCSPDQIAAARAIPVRACVITPEGKVCYSSKSGIELGIPTRKVRIKMSKPALPRPSPEPPASPYDGPPHC